MRQRGISAKNTHMPSIPKKEYGQRLNRIHEIMRKEPLDAILIYNAEKEDPAFLPWILGGYIFDTTYLLVTRENTFLFLPQWRLEEAEKAFTSISLQIIGTGEKTPMAPEIAARLQEINTIGFAGNVPYKEITALGKKTFKNIESPLRRLMEIKTDPEIDIMKQARRFTVEYMDSINWADWIGRSEKEIARHIESEMEKRGYPVAHLCLATGERTGKTTAGFPTDRLLTADDAICFDFGIGLNTYYSDITRCYFLGRASKYEEDYRKLKETVTATAQKLKAGVASKDILSLLKEEFSVREMGDNFIPADLGHGIGTGNHEYPEIGFDDSILEKGMVFTLEPEIRLSDGTLLRYEDMFYIDSDGKCLLME